MLRNSECLLPVSSPGETSICSARLIFFVWLWLGCFGVFCLGKFTISSDIFAALHIAYNGLNIHDDQQIERNLMHCYFIYGCGILPLFCAHLEQTVSSLAVGERCASCP